MMGQSQDYYSLLQVSADATLEDIKTSFRRLARQYHPDLNSDNTAETTAKFQQISQAYEILLDEEQRHRYDLEYYVPHYNNSPQKSCTPVVNTQLYFTSNRRANKFYEQGSKKLQQQKYQQAITKYSKAINLDPQFICAYLQRCEAYYHLDNYQEMLEDCYQIMKLNSSIIKAFYYQGIARYNLGLLSGAIASYSEVIYQDSHHAQAYYYRGIAYRDAQNNLSALQDFQIAGDLFIAQGNQQAYLLVKQDMSNLNISLSPVSDLVDGCVKTLHQSFKTAATVVKVLTR